MIRYLAIETARALLRFALDAGLRRALPTIYRRLDIELPFYWKERPEISSDQVLKVIASATSDAIGKAATPEQLALVRLLYDPVQVPRNLVRIRSKR